MLLQHYANFMVDAWISSFKKRVCKATSFPYQKKDPLGKDMFIY